jgi:hypothetical protein
MTYRIRLTRLASTLLASLVALVAAPAFAQDASAPATLAVEVAEIPGRFVFAGSTFDDGMPGYGATFLTQGWLYPAGTLDGEHGVEPDGSPTYPEAVIGRWTCRGWFVGDGVHTEEGPMAVTTQLFAFDDGPYRGTVVTDGYEAMTLGESFERAVVGSSGAFASARGAVRQTLVAMTEDMLVRYRFELPLPVAR